MNWSRTRLLLLLIAVPLLVVFAWYNTTRNAARLFDTSSANDHTPFAFLRDPPFIFAFGDSYTSEGWDGSSDPLMKYRVKNTANGPVWARALERSYTRTMLVNFAISGATVDNVLTTWQPTILDVRGQIAAFIKWFYPAPSRARWSGQSALFALGVGTNDVMIVTTKPSVRMKGLNQTAVDAFEEMMRFYFVSIKQLYKAGARAFLFHTLGPYDRAMAGVELGSELQDALRRNILSYNTVLIQHANEFCAKHADVFCLVHDTYNLTANVMDHYTEFGFMEPVNFCPAHKLNPTVEVDDRTEVGCVGPAGAYVWRDRLHPSWRFHQIWAQDVKYEIDKRLDDLALALRADSHSDSTY